MIYERFITLEGGEGAGKTSALKTIKNVLEYRELPYVMTREPGGTNLAERLRAILLDPKTGDLHPETELLLMQAARADHATRLIKPSLEEGKIVISDRFDVSSIAYQGGGRGYQHTEEMVLAQRERLGIVPGLTLYLDVPVSEGRKRVIRRGVAQDRFEKEREDFAQRVREIFLTYAQKDPTIRTIDASKQIDVVERNIRETLDTYLDSIDI